MRRRRLKRIQTQMRRCRPMTVCACRVLGKGFTYAVCPLCDTAMEREYVAYCSQCGQRLNWEEYASLFSKP